ncbi:hypothetical protein PENSPDRAFT_759745 [Peniophora sp. CONT]|nr:hypothetical protein PENSPDRAFT_759745 [Peniophora sp. CONT]
MTSDTQLRHSIYDLTTAEHANGVISYVLGLEEMSRRTFAVAVCYQHGNPTSPSVFRGFLGSCYRDANGHRPAIPLVHGAVPFYAGPSDLVSPPAAHTYQSSSGDWWHVLDVVVTDLSRIVPLGVWIPYLQRSSGHTAAALDRIEPRPFWIVPLGGGLGVSVHSSDTQAFHYGNWTFTHPGGGVRSTVYIRFQWPGYPPFEMQVRVQSNTDDSGTFKRLVDRVKGAVHTFISEYASEPSSVPRWAVGYAPGRISSRDVNLLAIVEVSQGAVMPILKVRDEFVFVCRGNVATTSSYGTFRPASEASNGRNNSMNSLY